MLRTTFGEVVQMTRAEAKLSTNTSRGIDHLDHIRQLIRRNVVTLAEQYDWQHLELKKESAVSRRLLQAGARTYAFPAAVNPMKITKVWVKWGSLWEEVAYGIKYGNYSAFDPDANQRTDPITNWAYYSDTEYEVWPLPASNGVANGANEVAFEGQRKTDVLTEDASRVDMDDILVSLMCSAEILQGDGKEKAAQVKADAAMARLQSVHGNLGSKKRWTIGLGAVSEAGSRLMPRHPTYIRKSG